MSLDEKERKRKWRVDNAEKVKTQRAAWKKANVEKNRESARGWYARNKEHHKKVQKAWNDANPARLRLIRRVGEAKRRAAKRGSKTQHTINDLLRRLRLQRYLCFYCEETLVEWHGDHFIPLALGGSNGPENIVIACPRCNILKGARMPDDPSVWIDIDAAVKCP